MDFPSTIHNTVPSAEATMAIAYMPPGHCLGALEYSRRKCLGALALSTTKPTGLSAPSSFCQREAIFAVYRLESGSTNFGQSMLLHPPVV